MDIKQNITIVFKITKMFKRVLLIATIALLPLIDLCAQQVNQLTNFMYNQLFYNPASAGMHETQVNVNIIGRVQWASIEKAPKLGHVWADYRFPKQNMALGINLGSFTYSKNSFTDINLNYAYFVNLSKKTKLSMGLRAGISSITSNTSNSTIYDENDPLIGQSNYAGTLPKIGLGFQLNLPKSYIGISAPDLFVSDNQKLLGDTASFFKKERNYVLMGGTKIRLNDLYNLKPSLAAYYHPYAGASATANLSFEIRDYFWFGAGYATYKAASITVGAHLSTRMRFAYAYEMLAGVSKVANIGSHEVCLLIKLDNLARNKTK